MASHPGTWQRATPAGATPCSANEASLVDALNEQGKFASTSDLRECKAKICLALSRSSRQECLCSWRDLFASALGALPPGLMLRSRAQARRLEARGRPDIATAEAALVL